MNGKHSLVVDSGKPNINAFSYIGVQLYELSAHGAFSPVTWQTIHLQTSTFAHPPAIQVLVAVKTPQLADSNTILSDDDFRLFSRLQSTRARISQAMAASRKRMERGEKH